MDQDTGRRSSFALSADGSLWVWGYNDGDWRTLGLGPDADFYYPTPQHLLPPTGDRGPNACAICWHLPAVG